MGMTSALYSALSGLNASQQRLDVAGNNIANVNTVAYKSSRAMFQTQLSRTISGGSAPSDVSGGTNPIQFGLGTQLGAIQKDMNGGSTETTGINTDMAIQGNGFFMLQAPDGSKVYTRDGSFSRNPNGQLVSSDGFFVLGYPVDESFNIQTSAPDRLTIPLGNLTIAEATTEANFDGTLNSGGTIAATPGTSISQALISRSTGAPATAATATGA
jgi:flagellar hook protein FlgE